jgi:hypothetical protein
VEDFRDYYWLKAELLDFCRQQGLPTSGSKQAVTERIAHFLQTGEILPIRPRSSSRSSQAMPETFTHETVIGSGWRCSQALRAFFEAEIGPNFHFNKVMRDFIKNESGKTLQEAIEAWEVDKQNPAPKTEIEPQFEYMRHMRAYFRENPEGTRAEALKAWHEKKSQRKSLRS